MKKITATILVIISTFTTVSNFVFADTTVSDTINVNLTVNAGTIVNPPGPTTPPTPVPEPLRITSVASFPETRSARIGWQTSSSAISELSWGRTQDYEMGVLTEGAPGTSHTAEITGLDPATTYYFKIAARTVETTPRTAISDGHSFRTRSRVPAPISFNADYDPVDVDVNLYWENPDDPDFSATRIVRGDTFFPQNETDGQIVYEGSAEFSEDKGVLRGNRYYYSLFVRSRSGEWSSPLVDDVYIPEEGETPPEEPPKDPFENFPTVPGLPDLSVLEFEFSQKDRHILFRSGAVPVDGTENLQISVDYEKLPEVLKTIGITLRHPKDKNKVFSFLLRVDDSKTKYTATIAPLLELGEYDMTITVLDYKNQGVKQVKGKLVVSGSRFINDPTVQALTKKVAPIGAGIGIAAGIAESVLLFGNINSLYDIYLMLARLLGAISGIFGVRKRREPWGTVYDAVTKRPIDPAYVTVKSGDTEVADSITDLDGRYGFLLPEGTYSLDAQKTHYQFPSKLLEGKTHDELYDNLYFGDFVSTKEGEVVVKNIPLDPIGFDWNEFVKNEQGLFRLYSRRERIKYGIFMVLYGFGFASAAFAFLVTPSLWNLIAVLFYLALLVFQTLWKKRHVAVRVRDAHTKEPIPFAIIRVFAANLNEQVKAVVADALGRFYILIAPGTYYMTVDKKKADGSYEKIYTSPVLELTKGVLRNDIVIGQEEHDEKGFGFGLFKKMA